MSNDPSGNSSGPGEPPHGGGPDPASTPSRDEIGHTGYEGTGLDPETRADTRADAAVGHETSDAMARPVLIFSITLVATLLVIVGVSLLLFYGFTTYEDRTMEKGSPLANLRPPPPTPPLQPSKGHETLPIQDWAALVALNDRIEHTYGSDQMSDRKVHTHIPVRAAVALLASTGLPSGAATDIPVPQGNARSMDTGYSNGGRGTPFGTAAAPDVPFSAASDVSSGGAPAESTRPASEPSIPVTSLTHPAPASEPTTRP